MPNSARTEEIRARVEKANAKTWPSIRHYEQASREFLDHARQDVPYLLTELTALREEVERFKGALADASKLLERYHAKCRDLVERNGSVYQGGEAIQFLLVDKNKLQDRLAALSPSPAQQEKKQD